LAEAIRSRLIVLFLSAREFLAFVILCAGLLALAVEIR
jgi:hypothetical protein